MPRLTRQQRIDYAVARHKFLREHPLDEVALKLFGMKIRATHVHHRKGRGKYLCDVSTFVATTKVSDNWIHKHPERARELGFLE